MSRSQPYVKKENLELHQTDNHLFTLISAIPDLVWMKNNDGIYINANKAFEDFFNMPIDTIVGKSDYDFFPKEIADVCKHSDRETIISKNVCIYEEKVKHSTETSQMILEVRKVPIHDNQGSLKWLLGIGRDITGQKANEEHLEKTKAKLSAVISTIPDLIWLKDLNGVYMLCNPSFERFFGANADVIIGKTDYDFISKEQADFFRQKDHEAIEAGEMRINNEEIIFAHDGRHAILETRKIPVYSGDKILGVLGIGRDITEQKMIEKRLQFSENQFRSLVENTTDHIIRYDLNARTIYINPQVSKTHHIFLEDIIAKTPMEYAHCELCTAHKKFARCHQCTADNKFNCCHKCDMHKQNIELENLIHTVIKTGERREFYISFRIYDQIQTQHLQINPEFDPEGNVIGAISVGRDVTALKKYESQLISNEQRLREAQNIAKLGHWELSFSDMSLQWSEEIYRIFELSSDHSPNYDSFISCVHPDDRELVDANYHLSVTNHTSYNLIHRLLFADGRIKYIHAQGETYYDDEGHPIRSIGTIQDVTEQKTAEKLLEHMAHHDPLIGLPNRMLAKQYAEKMIQKSKANKTSIGFLYIDLDGFKTINDTLGHSIGDKILKLIAERIQLCLPEHSILCRQGGDEFLLLMPDITEMSIVNVMASALLEMFEQTFEVESHLLSTSASIGIALYPDHGEIYETLLKNSDMAMYQAKSNGKNGYHIYNQQLNNHLISQFKLQTDLRQALRENQFLLHYQPQIDLATKEITGVEALIRWKHPQMGMIPPIQFISIAENNGLIVPIGEWVIREACRQLAHWNAQGINTSIAINISGVQFKRGNLYDVVEEALRVSGINPANLEFELTESIMMQDTEKTLEVVRKLKNLGIQLSIDDFGTGYSSLAYLKRFTVDKLKIDQSFVRDIVSDQEDAVIVQTIIQMAKSLNLKTIAEGVENKEALDIVESFGCDEVQGYHYSKPIEASDFEAFYHAFKEQ
jgi:diguanylate cyclase (GGDEF)-like protein/PAS domain S-box-containing protein